jgi:hypothetical protein
MKKIKITLTYDPDPQFNRGLYQITKLTNTTTVEGKRVGDFFDQKTADSIASNRKYDVTIIPAE